jgi:hypothetical protein
MAPFRPQFRIRYAPLLAKNGVATVEQIETNQEVLRS